MDELSAEEERQLNEHLLTCSSCQSRLDELIGEPPPVIFPMSPADDSEGDPPTIPGLGPLTFLNRGGMGCVYRAIDLKLKRALAVKVMTWAAARTPHVVDRFQAETQITAQLTHPHIVPIHDSGVLPDGRHYYTMKLVEGDTLEAKLKQRLDPAAALVPFLQSFVQVCQAVSFAHGRGVLHRDLKPQNIMVGQHGEVQVMDWGLARMRTDHPPGAGGDVTTTTLGVGDTTRGLVGTPAYMAPEQASGATLEWRPTADIYALGGILYFVLTGRAPRLGSPDEIRAQAREGTLVAPREVHRNVPRSLEAMCLTALTREPAERYQTVDELIADVQRWLADEPVSVWKEPLTVRGWRWVRRHRVAAASALATLLVATVILASVSGILAEQRGKLASANTQLDGQKRDLETANAELKESRQTAINNAAIAQTQARTAIETLSFVVTTVNRELESIAEAGIARQAIIEETLKRIDEVQADLAGRQTVDHTTMLAHKLHGDCYMTLAQQPEQAMSVEEKNRRQSQLGLATRAFLEAARVGRQLTAAQPESVHINTDLAGVLGELASCQLARDHNAGLATLNELERHTSVLIERFPDELEVGLARCDSLQRLAQFWWRHKRDTSMSRQYGNQALNVAELVVQQHGGDPRSHNARAAALIALGDVCLQERDSQCALEHYQELLSVRQKLQRDGSVPRQEADKNVAFALNRIGDAQLSQSDHDAARQSYEASLETYESLHAVASHNLRITYTLYFSYRNLGDVQKSVGNLDSAAQWYRKSLTTSESLVDAMADNLDYQTALSIALERLGEVRMNSDAEYDDQEGMEYFQRKLTVDQEIVRQDPTDPRRRRNLSIAHELLAIAQYLQGDAAASAHFREMAEIRGALWAESELDAEIHEDFLTALLILGRCQEPYPPLSGLEGLKELQRLDRGRAFAVNTGRVAVASHVTSPVAGTPDVRSRQLLLAAAEAITYCVVTLRQPDLRPRNVGSYADLSAQARLLDAAIDCLRECQPLEPDEIERLRSTFGATPLAEHPEFQQLLPERL